MTQHLLEEQARRYAKRAIMADNRGDVEEAIRYYKKAINLFTKIITLYPDTAFAPFYRELVEKYKKRVSFLEKKYSISIPQGRDGKEDLPFEIKYPGDRPSITFKDVIGLDNVKKLLKRIVIYPLIRPELFPLGAIRGILFYGPPGCGKTYLSIAVANEANAVLISVSAADIMTKWLGEAEKNVKKLFITAKNIASSGAPVIVFIDEVDGLLRNNIPSETGGESRVRSQFLTEMDGIISKTDENLPLFIIGTTNKPWLLDAGFIRRFQKRIFIPPPDKETRRKLFDYYLNKIMSVYRIDDSVDTEKLAEVTEGYSSFDIKQIVLEVQSIAAEEVIEKGISERPITMKDFVRVLRSIKPSIDRRVIARIREWDREYMSI